MNPQEAIQNVWRQLVQRRLLPVAVLLVAALAAVPFVLKKDAAPVPAAPAAPAAGSAETASSELDDSVVTLAQDGTPAKRRRVLGYSKNPFQPARAPKAEAAQTPAPSGSAVTPSTGGASDPSSSDGSSAPAGGPSAPTDPAAPVAPVDNTPRPKHELYSLTVRFGSSDSTLEKRNLPRLKALPSSEDALLVYLGPGKGGKSAVFMVDASLVPQGDGSCDPSPSNCETIELHEGETEFFDVTGEDGTVTAQYQLDLLKIKRRSTADAAKAAAARAKASKAGRRVLRARQASSGPLRYRYDTKSGTVRKIDKRAYKALVAKTARIAGTVAGGF